MSIIVYGPQGSGKTLHAEKLRAHFKLQRVVEPDAEDAPLNPFDMLRRNKADFLARNALFITNESPPPHLVGSRRCISIDRALAELDGRG